jgi:tetratricopeptide (TPR) repeat protein
LRQNSEAVEDFTVAIENGQQDVDVFYWRGVAHLRLRNASACIEDMNRVLEADERRMPAYLARAEAHFSLNDFAPAHRDYTTFLNRQPGHAPVRERRAMVARYLGLFADALADLDHLLAADPDNIRRIGLLVTTHIYLNQHDKALEAAERLVKLEDSAARSLLIRGHVQRSRKNWQAAEQDYLAAMDTASSDGERWRCHFSLAAVYHETNRQEEALQAIDRCIAMALEAGDAGLYTLACAYALRHAITGEAGADEATAYEMLLAATKAGGAFPAQVNLDMDAAWLRRDSRVQNYIAKK